mgnify:CR=1 FL=1
MSKKNVSAIVSGAGWISGFWHLMDKEMRCQGWTAERIHALVTETEPEEQLIVQIVRAMRVPGMPRTPAAKPIGLPTTYDQSIGLVPLIQRAVGSANLGNINAALTQERFPLTGTGVRTVNLRVERFIANETGENVAKRLTVAGRILANTGDLAGFLHDHPKEVEKYDWVVALSKDSRWMCSDGGVTVPYADVRGAGRGFGLGSFRNPFGSGCGVLVRCEPACR